MLIRPRLLTGAMLVALATLTACGGGSDRKADRDKGEESSGNGSATRDEEEGEEKEGGSSSSASATLEPGRWEMTTEMVRISAPGLPPQALEQMRNQRRTQTDCLTQAEVDRMDEELMSGMQNGNCSSEDFAMSGGRINGTMSCSGGQGGATANVRMAGEYSAQSLDMTMDMQMRNPQANQNMEMTARVSGRRVGACTGSEGGGNSM